MPPLLPASAVRGLAIRSFSTTSPVCALRDTSSNRPSPRSSPYYNNYNKYRSNQQQNQQQQQGNPGDAANLMMTRLKRDGSVTLRNKQAQLEQLRNQKNSADYLRQMPRRWEAGDVYSPHDMSPVEMQKWRKRSPRKADVVDALGIRPLDMYKNFSLIQEFTSTSGQITHSSGTSLRPVNQRKIAKMIRRVQGMGLYPTIHAHPEMIRDSFFPERR
ncbi:uncharacterized protein TRIREDRAFT_81140 [Trichoderma reesei QM6a]|uniref:Small ribosomal subunit protein bS18m n=1 Tax=Hypocrea jecorina (strain QM6a) TaxID=431241 RepID=G0RT67_HYPJQ|nr:uncharacterized protein TRIREDRAFT_81140 [Trichoderma reesei QM6a]EGR45507.1 hypothetical protein TRIREDRAFT_81140 [Trichoderma reesei QM6a]